MYTQLNQYHVILEAQPQFQQDPNTLQHLYIQANASSGTSGPGASTSFSSSGSSSAGSNATTTSVLYTPFFGRAHSSFECAVAEQRFDCIGLVLANTTTSSTMSNAVPLSAFTHFQRATEALSINHQGQFPAVTVSFNLAPNAALGSAITAIDKVQQDMHMPPSLQADFQGTAASFKNSLSNEALLILAALVTVYIVLGVLYESFIHPVTILSTLPSAGVGALLALMLFGQDLSVVAIIGIILLIGIVKKNGIMMVDFALEGERQHGKNATDAIYEASLLRFRPIMMTTMAALLGGLPLAFGTGIGSEIRRPLGIAMVGGLLLSQALTLYTTPVIYIFFDNLGQRFSPLARQFAKPRTARHNRKRRHESFRTFYPAAGGNDVADHRRSLSPGRSPLRCCRFLPCRRSIFPPSPSPPRCRVRALQIMASSVATPLERQFGHIAGVTEMTSASSLGSTSITIQFDLSRNIDGAARDVEAAISAARTYLADQSARQSHVSKSESRRCSDHDPRPDLHQI